MAERTEIKVTRTYSLDPAVIAWVADKAKQIVIQSNGEERHNESKVVNDILTAAMEADERTGNLPNHPKKRAGERREPVAA